MASTTGLGTLYCPCLMVHSAPGESPVLIAGPQHSKTHIIALKFVKLACHNESLLNGQTEKHMATHAYKSDFFYKAARQNLEWKAWVRGYTNATTGYFIRAIN